VRYLKNRLQVLLCGLAIAAWLGSIFPVSAQEPGPPPPDDMEAPQNMRPPKMNVDKEITRMAKRYALSDAQKTQIRPILIEEQQKLDAVFQDSSLTPEDRFSKMRVIHEEQVSRISAVLSDSQKARYQKDERGKDHQQGPDGPPPPPPGEGGGGPPPP
jgi:periplasmic protein CpxP/Spy